MGSLNSNLFTNKKEIMKGELDKFLSEHPEVKVLTEGQWNKYLEIKKGQVGEDLSTPEAQQAVVSLQSDMEVLGVFNVFSEKLVKSFPTYVLLPTLLNEELVFKKSIITDVLGIADMSIGVLIEKGKKAQVGETRSWGGVDYRKEANGTWKPVKGDTSPSTEKKAADMVDRLAQEKAEYQKNHTKDSESINSISKKDSERKKLVEEYNKTKDSKTLERLNMVERSLDMTPTQGEKPSTESNAYSSTDTEGKTVSVGDSVKIDSFLTSDPKKKQGQTGQVTKIESAGKHGQTVHVKFEDGTTGMYSEETFQKVGKYTSDEQKVINVLNEQKDKVSRREHLDSMKAAGEFLESKEKKQKADWEKAAEDYEKKKESLTSLKGKDGWDVMPATPNSMWKKYRDDETVKVMTVSAEFDLSKKENYFRASPGYYATPNSEDGPTWYEEMDKLQNTRFKTPEEALKSANAYATKWNKMMKEDKPSSTFGTSKITSEQISNLEKKTGADILDYDSDGIWVDIIDPNGDGGDEDRKRVQIYGLTTEKAIQKIKGSL